MANLYKSVGITTRANFDSIYTTPSSTEAIVKSLYFSNYSTGTYYVSAKVEITNGGAQLYLLNSGQVPPNTTLQVLDGNFVLNADCDLWVWCDQSSAVHATASILEIS